jgi:prevent-host-death family protein
MSERDDQPARVGVRELRQNLSIYLDRVKAGETLEVTERGEPVAILGPRPEKPMSVIDRLIAEGRVTPAKGDHRTLPPPPPAEPGARPLSEILQEMRDEDER